MALSTLILKDEAYIKLAGLQINLTENASASDILNALGISKALFFKGITSTTLADNATTSPIVISGANYTPEAGAVVIYDDSEFLWTGSKWERLGRDSSFKLTQSPVSSPSASGAALAFIDTISQNENGNITVTKKNLDTVPVAQGGSGKTTAVDAANVFLSALPAWTANPTDTTYFVRQDTGGSNSFGRVKAETIYNYIAGKASGTWSISVAGNAATATKLATARSLKTKLDSTTAVTFDGSADQDAIPVTGTLPIANGGTGGTTAETARLNLGIGNSRVFYGICTTAAGTAAKVVTCAEYDQLKAGDMVVVKFDVTNTAAVGSLTLSVNGSTAKNIKKLYNATGASNLAAAGELNKDGIAVFVYNGTYWLLTNADYNSTYYYTSIYCTTAAGTAAKVAAISGAQELTAGKYFQVWMLYSNTAQSALTLNISGQGAKPIYINGTASSSTNYTLPRGCYIVYYDGTNYHFRTDNKLPGSIGGNADTADAWATGRTLTIGGTGKTVNGSADVSWSLTEIGASVANTLTDGTSSAAPKISTTVNGVTGNEITLTKASTSVYGVTKLTSSYNATSPDTTLAINGAGVQAAIQTLDVAEVGASSTASDTSDGKYIAKIKEEDGKITATVFTTSVGNTVTAGTGDNAPKISTTVNGIIGNSVELTKASTSVYGATKLTDTYSSSNTTLATTGKALLAALQTLDSTLPTGSAASKTLTALSMVDGKMSTATFTDIAIAASQITSGELPIVRGGTGASTAAGARTNLGLGTMATEAATNYVKIDGSSIMTGDLNLLLSNNDRFVNYWYTNSKTIGASWRIGGLGTGSGDTNYFVIQSGTSNTSGSEVWNNAIRIGQNTFDAAFGGNVYPLTNNTKTLGTSSNKWSTVYATTFDGNATSASALKDSGNSTLITAAYSKAGLAYADYTWLAGWNGYELRAVNKSQFATASHTHDRIVQAAITIQTGSTAQAHINLATLMTWLITTKSYIPSGVQCYKYIPVSWSYAGNDILQFSAYGTNWEIQLAGCIMEFWGTATSSTGAGPFRLVIHTSPTQSYTSASGYQKVPVSSTWEYVCNGSGYSPTWVCLSHPYIIQVNPTNTPTAVGSIWVTT